MAYFSAIWLYLLVAVFSTSAAKYGFTADDISRVSVKGIHRDFIGKANPGVIDKACMPLELIFVRNGSLQVNLPCFESDVQFLICYLSTM